VDMVVEAPWGGHPSQVQSFYDVDADFIGDYVRRARSEAGFCGWVDEWIMNVGSQDQYLDKLGASRLEGLRAIPPYGYRPRFYSKQSS